MKPMGLFSFTFLGRKSIETTPAFPLFSCSDRDEFLYVCFWGQVMGIGVKKLEKTPFF
jgi:hypothetical protein